MKEKQIEEMAKDIENTILGLGIHLCNKSAEKLYNLGYRKIDKGKVVLDATETTEYLIDLLVDFDEMSFCPTTLTPNPDEYAIEWKQKLVYAIEQVVKETADKLFTYMDMNNLLEISKTELKEFFAIQHLLKK